MQEVVKAKQADGHVETASENAEQIKSLEFFSKEYDNLAKFRKQAGDKLNSIEKTLSSLLTEVNELSSATDRLRSTVTHIM